MGKEIRNPLTPTMYYPTLSCAPSNIARLAFKSQSWPLGRSLSVDTRSHESESAKEVRNSLWAWHETECSVPCDNECDAKFGPSPSYRDGLEDQWATPLRFQVRQNKATALFFKYSEWPWRGPRRDSPGEWMRISMVDHYDYELLTWEVITQSIFDWFCCLWRKLIELQ